MPIESPPALGLGLIGRTFGTVFGALGPTLGVTALVHLPLLLLLGAVVALYALELIQADTVALSGYIVVLGSLVMAPLSAAAMVQGLLQLLRGERLEVMASVRVALHRLWPVLLLALLVGLAIFTGILLLIVPGLVLACGLFVATPALLVERIGITEALRRSWLLTTGHKLSIFALLLVLGLVERAISALFERGLEIEQVTSGWVFILYFGLALALGILMTTLRAAGSVVAYFQIRRLREELDENELAEIFT